MKQNLFKNGLLKTLSWVATHTAWMTMAISPLAQAKQMENLAKETKARMQNLGMNKKQTIGEFWEKIKADVPGDAYYEIEAAVKENPNAPMPQFEFKTSKTSDGKEIPVLTFTENGRTHNIQIYGESSKFMKFNNTTLTESEVLQPASMFQKLMDEDKNLKQRYHDVMNQPITSAKNTTSKNQFKFFSQMDKATWKSMTPEQRVTYFIQMRLMYMDAKKVIEASKTTSGKKSASLEKLERIFKAMFPDVEAQQTLSAQDLQLVGTSSQTTKVTTSKGTISIPYDAKSCIVAGYVGKYVKAKANGTIHPHCSVDVAIANYINKNDLKYVPEATAKCVATMGANAVACNPIIYGYPNGSPICVSKDDKSFQIATHWSGPCDSKSRLTSAEMTKFEGKDYSKISPRAAQIEAIKKDQATDGFKLSKDFIEGVLKSKDQTLTALFQKGEWSQALEDEIKRIGTQFDNEIDEAIKLCEADVTSKQEKNQKGACDQLHGRKLFVEEVLKGLTCPQDFDKVEGKCVKRETVQPPVVPASACPEGSSPAVNPEWCTCKSSDGKEKNFKLVDHKELPDFCAKASVKPEVCEPEDDSCAKNCSTDYPPLTNLESRNGKCYCPGTDNIPKEDIPKRIVQKKKYQEFMKGNREYSCKFGPNWGKIFGITGGVLGAIGLGVGLGFLIKKTKTVTEVKTNTIDNTVTCKAPKYAVLVSTGTGGGANKYECTCPSCPTYMLANGQKYQGTPNPISCVCAPPPTEGGTGTNPNDDSGGVPGNVNK